MADETNNREHDSPNEKSVSPDPDERPEDSAPAIVDEYGEPLADEHEHARKRPLYQRPVFLISASVILLLAIIFGVRYWAYARAHESTDDAFVDGQDRKSVV